MSPALKIAAAVEARAARRWAGHALPAADPRLEELAATFESTVERYWVWLARVALTKDLVQLSRDAIAESRKLLATTEQ